MKYYVTIYIDPLIECFMDFKEKCFINIEGFTHAFLGLTKGKSPDELDEIDKALRDKKLKMLIGKILIKVGFHKVA